MRDTPTQRKPPSELDRVLAAHERRARLIAQVHKQAMEPLPQQKAIKAGIAKIAQRRKIEVIAGASVVALGCILVLLAMM